MLERDVCAEDDDEDDADGDNYDDGDNDDDSLVFQAFFKKLVFCNKLCIKHYVLTHMKDKGWIFLFFQA